MREWDRTRSPAREETAGLILYGCGGTMPRSQQAMRYTTEHAASALDRAWRHRSRGFADASLSVLLQRLFRLGAPVDDAGRGRWLPRGLVGYFEGIDSERGMEWRSRIPVATGVSTGRGNHAGASCAGQFLGQRDAAGSRCMRMSITPISTWDSAPIAAAGLVPASASGSMPRPCGQPRCGRSLGGTRSLRGLAGRCWRAGPWRRHRAHSPRPRITARLDLQAQGRRITDRIRLGHRRVPGGQDRQGLKRTGSCRCS